MFFPDLFDKTKRLIVEFILGVQDSALKAKRRFQWSKNKCKDLKDSLESTTKLKDICDVVLKLDQELQESAFCDDSVKTREKFLEILKAANNEKQVWKALVGFFGLLNAAHTSLDFKHKIEEAKIACEAGNIYIDDELFLWVCD